MSSEIKADKWSPASGTAGTIGDSGDTFTVPSGATLTASAATVNLPTSIITGQSEKTTLVDADKFLISDSAASGAFKYVQKSNLPSGAMTLLHADESTSAVSEKNYDYFSSTYTNYLITGSVSPATDDVDLWFQWRSSGSAQNASYYINNANYSFVASGSNGTNNRFEYNDDHAELAFRASNNDDKKIDFEILVFDPMNTAEYTKMLYRSTFASAVSSWVFDYGSSYYNTAHTSAMDGFKILTSAGNIDVRKVYIYGLAKA